MRDAGRRPASPVRVCERVHSERACVRERGTVRETDRVCVRERQRNQREGKSASE